MDFGLQIADFRLQHFEWFDNGSTYSPPTGSPTKTITDISGRTMDEVVITGEKTIWDASVVASGTYFYQFDDGKQVSSGKIFIAK